jgi:hypothetical protein
MLEGITDRVEYRLNHFGMLFSRRCTAQVARFLATGKFQPVPASTSQRKVPAPVTR